MSNIGNRIKALRRRDGLTQEQLGEAIGLTFSGVSSIEKGVSKNPEKLLQIAKYFNVNYEWLLSGDGEVPNGIIIGSKSNPNESMWKEEAYSSMKNQVEHLKEEIVFLRQMLSKVNFLNALTKAGARKGKEVYLFPAGAQVGAQRA
jgi:transcriptional regulator with XRE-family HTH domain